MGKINEGMRKSRAGINEVSHEMDNKYGNPFGVSPVESQGKLTQAVHEWYFALDYPRNGAGYSKFACLCGAVKRVKQFEVEE